MNPSQQGSQPPDKPIILSNVILPPQFFVPVSSTSGSIIDPTKTITMTFKLPPSSGIQLPVSSVPPTTAQQLPSSLLMKRVADPPVIVQRLPSATMVTRKDSPIQLRQIPPANSYIKIAPVPRPRAPLLHYHVPTPNPPPAISSPSARILRPMLMKKTGVATPPLPPLERLAITKRAVPPVIVERLPIAPKPTIVKPPPPVLPQQITISLGKPPPPPNVVVMSSAPGGFFQMSSAVPVSGPKSPRLQRRSASDQSPTKSAPIVPPPKSRSNSINLENVYISDEVVLIKKNPSPAVTPVAPTPMKNELDQVLKNLLCEENIEDMPDESNSSKSVESVGTTKSLVSEKVEDESTTTEDSLEVPKATIKSIRDGASEAPVQMGALTSILFSSAVKRSRNDSENFNRRLSDEVSAADPFNKILWIEGVGYLRGSTARFQYNEYGMVELMGDEDFYRHCRGGPDHDVEQEISKRSILSTNRKKRRRSLDTFLYKCSRCGAKGIAKEFLAPDFCSQACFNRVKIERQNREERAAVGEEEEKPPPVPTPPPPPTPTPPKRSRKKPVASSDSEVEEVPVEKEKRKPPKQREPPKLKRFDWDSYLEQKRKEVEPPLELFRNKFPTSSNEFEIGMKVEAIDPQNQSLFCVCSVVEKRGYRIKLRFDNYSINYDFWVNADSHNIFPPGFCAATGRQLSPPPLYTGKFDWKAYTKTHRVLAPPRIFPHLDATSQRSPFRLGMKLETEDIQHGGKLGIASIADILGDRILIHFDSFPERFDYWVEATDPSIHPAGWHATQEKEIRYPAGYSAENFEWSKYLAKVGEKAAPEECFKPRQPVGFVVGHKFEVVDPRNPALIRPASVVAVEGCRIKVLFDGWSEDYAFWLPDISSDIYPMDYCVKTDHPIEYPPGTAPSRANEKRCPVISFCRGIGNIINRSMPYHSSAMECPYTANNWNGEALKNRLDSAPVRKRKGKLPWRQKSPPPQEERRKTVKREVKSGTATPAESRAASPEVKEEEEEEKKESRSPSLSPEPGPVPEATIITAKLSIAPLPETVRLENAYTLFLRHATHLQQDMNDLKTDPMAWSVDEVAAYITQLLSSDTLGDTFRENEIDGAALLSLSKDEMLDLMKLKMGQVIKIYARILQLRQNVIFQISE